MDRRGQGWREHRQQAGGAPQGILTAAVLPRSDAENRRSPAGFPLPFRILQLRRHGVSDSPYRHPVPGGSPARNRMAVWVVVGPLQCPCQWHGHCRGPRKRAPLCISVSALQTLKYATGATAPVAPSHSAGSILSRRPRGKALLHWDGGRPFGGRPPAQCKSQNTLSGLTTAERYFGGGNSGGRPPPPARVRITP
ncbi:hypothetical protein NDU88_003367 [Pleurodeles waltl]|uniref:Uncharacterized protein n=1 Tax=Pleurodeles waltl TaxID=8319 RepID=A0AAV7P9U9_PLEWA|nr:hypothetical protein NDU88_003367 [Pleurodeles waltl]